MAVGFGFSVGDFVATLTLVATMIDALRSASRSTTAFWELLNELSSLERALMQVKSLDLDDSHHFEKIALYQAASQCQHCINTFWNRIPRYQPHLSQAGTTCSVKDGWMKIRWAVCEKKEVDGFRTEIQAHTASIQVLLGALQANATAQHLLDQRTLYTSLASSIQSFSMHIMGKISAIADGVSKTASHSASLGQTCAQILWTNLQVFRMVYDIQLFITKIPNQIQRQQPVYFVDPFNRESPFHLEFVRSAEALLAILKVNLKHTGCGPRMIERGDFVFEELGSQTAIDIAQPWETCFRPGQRVAMSMVIKYQKQMPANVCPKCGKFTGGNSDHEVICCPHCGIAYCSVQTRAKSGQKESRDKFRVEKRPKYSDSERGLHQERYNEMDAEDDPDAALRMFGRVKIHTTPWTWDFFPAYRLRRGAIQEFLRQKFGPHDFCLQFHSGDCEYRFRVPRRLTIPEREVIAQQVRYPWDW